MRFISVYNLPIIFLLHFPEETAFKVYFLNLMKQEMNYFRVECIECSAVRALAVLNLFITNYDLITCDGLETI